MIDINLLSTNKKELKEGLIKKGYDVTVLNELEKEVTKSKDLKKKIDTLRQKRNEIQNDKGVSVDEKRELRSRITKLEEDLVPITQKINDLLYDIPNLPEKDAPVGKTAEDNVVIVEDKNYFKCKVKNPVPHWEIGSKLDILDNELATKISGPMFALFKGKGSKLLRALVWYEMNLNEEKYLEITPPHMVSTRSLTYTGHLPKFAKEQYKCQEDDLWLIPTAEVPLTAGFAQTTFGAGELPASRMGYTVAFRREAGSAGKDTRGLQRIHEFHKVELLKIVEPQQLQKELKILLDDCLKIIKDLKLQYRIVDLCTGDMGDKYARCYDIEVYCPGIQKWQEVASVGHFSDYQARRAGIKYVNEKGEKTVAYTMNGSGVATPRVWAAIVETYQQADGTVIVPEVLREFMGCDVIS